jgi:hypothetical protein
MISLGEMIAYLPIVCQEMLLFIGEPNRLNVSLVAISSSLSDSWTLRGASPWYVVGTSYAVCAVDLLFQGWNYWYNWTIILPAELSAAAILINYWNKSVNNAAWITICLAVVVAINMCGAGVYGEAEFIFASIKVITIVGK